MSLIVPLELTGLTKVFATDAGPFVAVKDVNLRIHKSEFICIVGHSGCGKSTVLSMIAGLQRATKGGVVINGRQTVEPGADRAVVFQTPSLLPWLTARQNVELALRQKFSSLKASERRAHALRYLALTSVADAAEQLPGEMSLGTHIDVSHSAATPAGLEVIVTTSLVRVDGRRLFFEVAAHDGIDAISQGRHERYVIDRARFEAGITKKRTAG